MSDKDSIKRWLKDQKIDDVEAFVPDMAGAARGKVLPADSFGDSELKLPEGIFAQTISGNYVDNEYNVEDRDMILEPDPATIRPPNRKVLPGGISSAASCVGVRKALS